MNYACFFLIWTLDYIGGSFGMERGLKMATLQVKGMDDRLT